ncbi:MAG TPA: tetratricopeptide repeat protein [Planctomycetota bacterium]|nr:tetratricopeptide repeat protein [Planctomycetota bacterium]
MIRHVTAAALVTVLLAVGLHAQDEPPAEPAPRDTLRMADGKILPNVLVISETPTEVKIDTNGDSKPDRTLDQNEVTAIQYGGAPTSYREAVAFYKVKQYDKALEKFREATSTPKVRKWVTDYSAYYTAMCLAGQSVTDPTQQGRAIAAFETLLNDADNRWRDDARYRLGEIYLAAGDKPKALTAFRELESGAYKDEMKLTASVGLGALMMADDKASEALQRYDKVVTGAKGRFRDLYETATVGKAEALTALKRYDEARTFLGGVVESATGDDLLAKARLALGDCYYADAQNDKDETAARQKYKAALKNYLWNIVVFYNQRAEYAKALLYAGRCWEKLGQDTRAQELYRELRSKFGSTRWVGMIGK